MNKKSNMTLACKDCALRQYCLPSQLKAEDMDKAEAIVVPNNPIKKNENLYLTGESMSSIHIVKVGSVKTYVCNELGEESVTGFHLPGDILGLEGLHSLENANSASALEPTLVCKIPCKGSDSFLLSDSELPHYFLRLLSREMKKGQKYRLLIAKRSAEARLSGFILFLSQHLKQRNLSSTCFRLPMSKADLANYLGLAAATLSRALKQLEQNLVIKSSGRDLEILNLESLELLTREA